MAPAVAPMQDQPRPAAVGRLFSADAAALLNGFDAAGLMASGQVNLIGLDSIARRMGSRWSFKREQVYAHVDRTLGRHLGDDGVSIRVSETDYLVIQPDLGRCAAQASCFRYLRELLTYFLGDHRGLELKVLQVTRYSENGVETLPVDAAEAEKGEAEERGRRRGEVTRVQEWSPFLAADGRSLNVSCRLELVLELKTYRRIGYRMARTVVDKYTSSLLEEEEVRRLSRADLERIDCATITRGIDRMEADPEGTKALSLMIPVSYATLSNRRSRTTLVNLCTEAQLQVQRGLICEITDAEGVPPSALIAAVTLIKPFCLFVVGRRRPPYGSPELMAASGLQGVTIECPPEAHGDALFAGWAREAIQAGKRVAKTVMLLGLPSTRHMAVASHLGASHASLRSAPVRSSDTQLL